MKKIDFDLEGKGSFGGPETKPYDPGKEYPRFDICCDERLALPAKGKMVVEYKISHASVDPDADAQRTKFRYTIEVCEICEAESSEPRAPAKNGGKETEDALDALAKMASEEEEDEEKED